MHDEDLIPALTPGLPNQTGTEFGVISGKGELDFPAPMTETQRMRLLGLSEHNLAELSPVATSINLALSGEDSRESSVGQQSLVGRLTSVLRLAYEHVGRLAEYRDRWVDGDDPLVTLADKIVVESAILALVAQIHAGKEQGVSHWVDRLARSLAPCARSYRNEILIRRYPHVAISLGVAHAALSALDAKDPQFDQLVRDALASGLPDCVERIPYRAMERRWLWALLEPGSQLPQFDDLLAVSIASQPAHPIYMLATDIYALTHVPMFVTGFGQLPIPHDFPRQRCLDSLDAAISWVLYTDNFDLLGELILARVLLRAPWTASQFLAWKTIEYAWEKLGFLTAPSFAIKQFHDLPPDEKSAYAFRHVYHTTYVAGILCATLIPASQAEANIHVPVLAYDDDLRQECRSAFQKAMALCASAELTQLDVDKLAAATLDRPEPPLDAIQRLISVWQSRDPNARRTILDVVGQVDLPDAWVASSLADGLLSCCARAYDLPMLSQTLRVIAATGLPVTTTVAAAARFLIRQQLPSGAIGGWFLAAENRGDSRMPEITAGLASCLGALSVRLGQ